jgi:hypothetical protein
MEHENTTLADILAFLTDFRNEVNSRFESNEARLSVLENPMENPQEQPQSQPDIFTPFYGNRMPDRRRAELEK